MSDDADTLLLDLAFLKQQTMNSSDLEAELLGMLAGQCQRLGPLIRHGSNLEEQADSAHGLKGACRSLGALRLAALLEGIERAMRAGQHVSMTAFDELDDVIARTVRAADLRRADLTESGFRS